MTAILVVAMVGCILVAGFIPVVGESVSATTTFENDGYFRMTHYGTDADVVLTWSVDNPTQVVVNDVVVPVNYDVVGGAVTVVADTNFISRLNSPSSGYSLSYIGVGGGTHTATVSASYTFSNGSATIVNTIVGGETETYSATYEDIYVPSIDGEFTMKKYDESAYINEDSFIFAYGNTRIKNSTGGVIASPGIGFEFSGSIADGVEGRVWRGPDTVTVADEQINYASVNGYIDLYSFDSITATATYTETVDDETVTTDTLLTYNYLLVPYQVTAEKAIHADDNTASIISMLPFILIMGIVIMFVGVVLVRRYV